VTSVALTTTLARLSRVKPHKDPQKSRNHLAIDHLVFVQDIAGLSLSSAITRPWFTRWVGAPQPLRHTVKRVAGAARESRFRKGLVVTKASVLAPTSSRQEARRSMINRH